MISQVWGESRADFASVPAVDMWTCLWMLWLELCIVVVRDSCSFCSSVLRGGPQDMSGRSGERATCAICWNPMVVLGAVLDWELVWVIDRIFSPMKLSMSSLQGIYNFLVSCKKVTESSVVVIGLGGVGSHASYMLL